MKKISKTRTMWKVVGLEDAPNNDRNLYMNKEQAEINAPIPSFYYPVEVVIIGNPKII